MRRVVDVLLAELNMVKRRHCRTDSSSCPRSRHSLCFDTTKLIDSSCCWNRFQFLNLLACCSPISNRFAIENRCCSLPCCRKMVALVLVDCKVVMNWLRMCSIDKCRLLMLILCLRPQSKAHLAFFLLDDQYTESRNHRTIREPFFLFVLGKKFQF